jgi:hypothetical protein
MLLLLNPTHAPVRAEIAALPTSSPKPQQELTATAPIERRAGHAGVFSLPIHTRDGGTHQLHAAGVEALWFVGVDGQLANLGDGSIPIQANGTATVRHDGGLLQLWLEAPGEPGKGLWGEHALGEPVELTPPTVHPLSGPVAAMSVSGSSAGILQLRGSDPVVARVVDPDGKVHVTRHPQGLALDLPADRSITLHLRPIAAASLPGAVEVTRQPPTPLEEGVGPRRLLAAGSAAAFSIDLDRHTTIGVGVRSTSGIVEARLIDTAGTARATGPAQMVELQPGVYTLVVAVPANGKPAVIQPVVVGLEDPGTGPPDDVLRSYLKGDPQ